MLLGLASLRPPPPPAYEFSLGSRNRKPMECSTRFCLRIALSKLFTKKEKQKANQLLALISTIETPKKKSACEKLLVSPGEIDLVPVDPFSFLRRPKF